MKASISFSNPNHAATAEDLLKTFGGASDVHTSGHGDAVVVFGDIRDDQAGDLQSAVSCVNTQIDAHADTLIVALGA